MATFEGDYSRDLRMIIYALHYASFLLIGLHYALIIIIMLS
jgi:hypothetical protein